MPRFKVALAAARARRAWLLGPSCAWLLGPACAAPSPRSEAPQAATQPQPHHADAPVRRADVPARRTAPKPSLDVVVAAPAPARPASTPQRSSPFPPPAVVPPSARSAEPSDGQWQPLGDPRRAAGEPLLVTTTLHPHPTSRFITLTVVAADLSKLEVRFMPGVDDVGKASTAFVPGLVPEAERDRLIAAFNGGFLPQHGRWGLRLGATEVMPPREGGCTLLLTSAGKLAIAPWSRAAADAKQAHALRQTPPCLLDSGTVHPDLLRGNFKAWKGQTPGIVTRRRSALGLSQDRQTLFYAIGMEASPALLAAGLRAAGAHDAAQLDINWNWTRFLLFGESDGKLRVTRALLPVEHTSRDYVEIPSRRDFFYLTRSRP